MIINEEIITDNLWMPCFCFCHGEFFQIPLVVDICTNMHPKYSGTHFEIQEVYNIIGKFSLLICVKYYCHIINIIKQHKILWLVYVSAESLSHIYTYLYIIYKYIYKI